MQESGRQLWRVSMKGVVFQRGRMLLLRNEQKEWELPGGVYARRVPGIDPGDGRVVASCPLVAFRLPVRRRPQLRFW